MEKIKFYLKGFKNTKKYLSSIKYSQLDKISAELIRYTHSIEKGLSITNPRLGFGHEKQKKMMDLIVKLKNSSSKLHHETILMGIAAFKEYIAFHRERNYTDDFLPVLEEFIKDYDDNSMKKYGGTLIFNKSCMDFQKEEIEKFFKTRHSIRDFEETEVDKDLLKKALELAQTAPSACNRQGVRAYVLGKDKYNCISGWVEGIGGFADNANKFILITAKTSAYRLDEVNQYIVSASIYAAYLSLTLHLYGIGACFVQRPVVWSKKWENLKKKLDITNDEQIICMLAIGNLKQECKVPVSHRLEYDEIIKFL